MSNYNNDDYSQSQENDKKIRANEKNLDSALQKLNTLIENQEIIIFTTEEAETLRQVAAVWKGLETFGKVAGVVRKVAIYLTWMVGAWYILKGYFHV